MYEVSHISRRVKWFSTENLGAPNGGDPGPILPPDRNAHHTETVRGPGLSATSIAQAPPG